MISLPSGETRPILNPDRCPTHPGEILRKIVLPKVGKPKAELAKMLGISRQTVYKITSEWHPLTPQIAVRLGELLGNGPGMWVNKQSAHDLWYATRE